MDFILWLQETNNGLFDIIARTLHFMGHSSFYLIVLPLIFWSLDRQLGLRMLIALITSLAVNTIAKELFQQPRPYLVNPQQVHALFEESTIYGFPSGHVMSTVLVWGTAALYLQKRWLTIGVVILTILMAWGRMYGGVHYPGDVVGGMVFGGVTLAILWRSYEPVTTRLSLLNLIEQTAIVIIFGLISWVSLHNLAYGRIFIGLVFGVGAGLIIEHHYIRFSTDGTSQKQAIRYFLGLVIIGITYGVGGKLLGDLLSFALVGLTAIAIYPFIAIKTGLMQTTINPEQ